MNKARSSSDRREPMPVPRQHKVKGTPLQAPFPDHLEIAVFGRGCFWGVEERFWSLDGVYSTAVGYAGGTLAHPTYPEVCTGDTGHAEVVQVVYDPSVVTFERLLEVFWKGHRPYRTDDTEVRDQYRSVIYTTTDRQLAAALASRDRIQAGLPAGVRVATEISPSPGFFYAESRHQQYAAR